MPAPAADVTAPCNSCGSTHREVLFEKWGFPIVSCTSCGLASTAVPPGFDPSRIYDEGYFSGGQKDGYGDYAGSEQVLRAEFRGALRHLRELGYAGGRLLEVGSAYGFFLLEAQRSFECQGIEISEPAVAHCRARGLDVRLGTATESNLPPGPFDVCVMLDVIEHLPDPHDTLQRLHARLRPGGAMMITTGDWSSALARLTGTRWRLMTPPQHLFFFTRAALASLLVRCGFEVIDCARPWKLVPLGLMAYQLTRRVGLRLSLPPLLNRLTLPVNLLDTIRMVARRGG